MLEDGYLALGLVGVVVVVAGALIWRGQWSAEARTRRRRLRSHRRVISKAKRPMIKLAVKPSKRSR